MIYPAWRVFNVSRAANHFLPRNPTGAAHGANSFCIAEGENDRNLRFAGYGAGARREQSPRPTDHRNCARIGGFLWLHPHAETVVLLEAIFQSSPVPIALASRRREIYDEWSSDPWTIRATGPTAAIWLGFMRIGTHSGFGQYDHDAARPLRWMALRRSPARSLRARAITRCMRSN